MNRLVEHATGEDKIQQNTNWQDTINSVFNLSKLSSQASSKPTLKSSTLPIIAKNASKFETTNIPRKFKRPVLIDNPKITGIDERISEKSSVQTNPTINKLSFSNNTQGEKVKLDPSWTTSGPPLACSNSSNQLFSTTSMNSDQSVSCSIDQRGALKNVDKVEVLKTQIGEMKSYILKLEEEKRKLGESSNFSSSTCTCAQVFF